MYRVMVDAPASDVPFHDVQEACWTPVFRFALALTNEWDAAEDLAQEAFTRLWTHRDTLDWTRPMLPWLLTTTRRLALDRFRRIRRALARRQTGPSTLDGDDRVRWLDVQRAIGRLPAMDRAALTMVAVEGMSNDEVAAALGTTSGAVRARISRARRQLGEQTA